MMRPTFMLFGSEYHDGVELCCSRQIHRVEVTLRLDEPRYRFNDFGVVTEEPVMGVDVQASLANIFIVRGHDLRDVMNKMNDNFRQNEPPGLHPGTLGLDR